MACGIERRTHYLVFDVDGTRQAARKPALPQTADLPPAQRRFGQVCAPGYLGRKRGEVVRTRTTLLQAHTQQWLGTFSAAGNGDYRGELRRALAVISTYVKTQHIPLSQAVVQMSGQFGDGAIVADLAGLAYVMRGKDYHLLDLAVVQARLLAPPDGEITHPESGTQRALFDFPRLQVTPASAPCRVIVATHPASSQAARVGTTRGNVVYELFFTAVPVGAFSAADVVALYLHRGANDPVLSDEDQEQVTSRWCSHSACGQEFWQILSQWVWNLRLELGHVLHPTPMRSTEFASATPAPVPASVLPSTPVPHYGPPIYASTWKRDRMAGQDFAPQPAGTLRCQASHLLYPQERRPERDGTLRVVYAARIGHCRPCPLREQCQWHGNSTKKPRRVSAVLHPQSSAPSLEEPAQLPLAALPLLWGDWERRSHRRNWVKLLRHEPGRRPTVCHVPASSARARAPSFSRRAGTLPSLLDPTSGAPCHGGWFALRLNHPVRATGSFCRFPGLAEGLTPSPKAQAGWFFSRSKSAFRASRPVFFSTAICSFISIYLFYFSCSQPCPISSWSKGDEIFPTDALASSRCLFRFSHRFSISLRISWVNGPSNR